MGFTPKNYAENMKANSFGKFVPEANSSYMAVILTKNPAEPAAALVEGRFCHDVSIGKDHLRVRCTAPQYNSEFPETEGITECLLCKEFYAVNRAVGAQGELETKGMNDADRKAWYRNQFNMRQHIRGVRATSEKTEGAYYAVAIAVFKTVDNKLQMHEVEFQGKKVTVPKYFVKYLMLSKKKFDAMVEDIQSSMAQLGEEFNSFGLITLKTSCGDVKSIMERAKNATYTMALKNIPQQYPDIVPMLIEEANKIKLVELREFRPSVEEQANLIGRMNKNTEAATAESDNDDEPDVESAVASVANATAVPNKTAEAEATPASDDTDAFAGII